MNNTWRQLYEEWLNSTVIDGETKAELRPLAGSPEEIKERFDGMLEFGTGGMRGIIGAGTRRMNKYVVRWATQGLANYLRESYPQRTEKKTAIAFDSRHRSREFAEETALVLAANGIKALLFEQMRPVPQLSFAVREFGCLAGVVITASHNPPHYNGYKLYGEDGGQLVPEQAGEIIRSIKAVHLFNGVRTISREEALAKGLLEYISEDFDDNYVQALSRLSFMPGDKSLGVVFSPLHGAGVTIVPRVLKEWGFKNVYIVEKQAVPDPDFSTVKVPNPEDREAFTLALELAGQKQAHLILLTDPDVDRVGCAVRNAQGSYTLLNGNQVGALLVEYILGRLKEKGRLPSNGVIIKTVVTGNLGKEIAAGYGIETLETLTGFKYIGEKIKQFEENKERRFLFGYEESYGYLAGTHARDKDAVVASALIAEMTAFYYERGQGLLEVLEELYRRHGYFLEDLVSRELKDLTAASEIMESFRDGRFDEVGGFKIMEKRDYREQKARNMITGETRFLELPRSDVLYFLLENDSWFCIRPSGTEPKLKYYFSVKAASGEEAAQKLASLKKALLEA